MKKMWLLGLALLAGLPAWAQVQGAGATFPSKVYERWAQSYEKHGGDKVVYKPTGSGDGIKQASARSVQFGGTDSPLPAEELVKRRLVQIPMLVGGIVPVVHLTGVADNRLQLDGALLADIMAGRIARWNDARIAALNPGLALPALPIKRIVRADKSGTTDGFTRYLAQLSPAFKQDDAEPETAARAGPALRFLYWSFMHGDDLTRGTGFAPLPTAVQSRLAARFAAVKARDGKVLDYFAY